MRNCKQIGPAVCRMGWGLAALEGNDATSVVLSHISKATALREYLLCAVSCGEHRQDAQTWSCPPQSLQCGREDSASESTALQAGCPVIAVLGFMGTQRGS